MRKIAVVLLALFVLVGPASAAGGKIAISPIVDVSRDQLSQNETPIAVNPANPANLITGANDWNYNDGCAVNASSDGGKTWTPPSRTASCPASRSTRTTRTSRAPAHTTREAIHHRLQP